MPEITYQRYAENNVFGILFLLEDDVNFNDAIIKLSYLFPGRVIPCADSDDYDKLLTIIPIPEEETEQVVVDTVSSAVKVYNHNIVRMKSDYWIYTALKEGDKIILKDYLDKFTSFTQALDYFYQRSEMHNREGFFKDNNAFVLFKEDYVVSENGPLILHSKTFCRTCLRVKTEADIQNRRYVICSSNE